jgi:hypothetical protein
MTVPMQDFEKLGAFYLGRRVDPAGTTTDDLVLYDARDLTTHAVIIGMTGSGKTGLGIGLIEEAALDHVPVIAIDPKGDLGNLLLTFPELRAQDFAPWVDRRAAAEQGQSPEDFARRTAELWRSGLAKWGQAPDRIAALRAAADMAIYTPGSAAGRAVSVLREFRAPPEALRADRDLYRERVQNTATSILTLLGMEADPVTSPEHILLANILDHSWQHGTGLDLAGLIGAIQNPPIDRVGVMDLDSFFPPRERFALAMRMNNLLAAPGFEAWMEGVPLDADTLFHGPGGKPQVSIMSIAHLGDAERMFFVSMLLTEIIAWMRRQPGSGSLRALLYMDEIFGYMPPVASPPSKTLLLTLLKQARAYGLGIVLATQNPVDLDYKGLSNTGTWFIGRLQTERDKARVREGLQGASGGDRLPPAALDAMLAGLGKRRFLLHNVHEQEPVIFETRWVMSYLAGPLTRQQIKSLSPDEPPATAAAPAAPAPHVAHVLEQAPPVLDPAIRQFFVEAGELPEGGHRLVYYPRLLAAGSLAFRNARLGIDEQHDFMLCLELDEDASAPRWNDAEELNHAPADLAARPEPDAAFAAYPAALGSAQQYATWEKGLRRWLRDARALQIYKSPRLKETSRPGETERDFRIRLQQAGNEARDRNIAKLRTRYDKQVATLEDRLRRAQQVLEVQAEQARGQKLDTAISFGTAVLGALLGRKRASVGTASRVGTAARKASRVGREDADVRRAEETVAAVRDKLAELQASFDSEVAALEEAYDAQTEELETLSIRPRTTDVQLQSFGLGWIPYIEDEHGRLRPA